jgi:hypothetical protein
MGTFVDVEVQNTLTGGWSPGFQVIDTERTATGEEMFRLQRQSDGFVLPAPISVDRVRSAKPSVQSK